MFLREPKTGLSINTDYVISSKILCEQEELINKLTYKSIAKAPFIVVPKIGGKLSDEPEYYFRRRGRISMVTLVEAVKLAATNDDLSEITLVNDSNTDIKEGIFQSLQLSLMGSEDFKEFLVERLNMKFINEAMDLDTSKLTYRLSLLVDYGNGPRAIDMFKGSSLKDILLKAHEYFEEGANMNTAEMEYNAIISGNRKVDYPTTFTPLETFREDIYKRLLIEVGEG